MTKKKSKTNWYFLVVGIPMLCFAFIINQPEKNIPLTKITVKLSEDIRVVRSRRSSTHYEILTIQFKNEFYIREGSIAGKNHELVLNLKGGQEVELDIPVADYGNLASGKEDIDVRGIKLNGIYLMDPKDYIPNRNVYHKKMKIFMLFTGLMLLLNGLSLLSSKLNYWIIGLFIGGVILMAVFDVGIF